MLILRIGNRGRWASDRVADNPAHAEAAAKDLKQGPRHQGLSVYRAEDQAEQDEVALRFALTCRDVKTDHVDYVVFPAELAENLGLTVTHRPLEGLDPYLKERHYEIIGLTPELGRTLATFILADAGRRADRLERGKIPRLGAALCRRDPALSAYLGDGWSEILKPLMNEPISEG